MGEVEGPTDRHGLLVLDPATCFELLASEPVGRVAFALERGPELLPVNFAVDDETIVFRSSGGSKLAAAAQARNVVFEADHYDAATHEGWSVVVHGSADLVTEPAELDHLYELGLEPWGPRSSQTDWVRIVPALVSGRRILAT